jgi:7,8-dihydropterin-6-yl-methyl-4-(beta-D-ribofuranosyl)aminobenzene 5'-phosphate synthase
VHMTNVLMPLVLAAVTAALPATAASRTDAATVRMSNAYDAFGAPHDGMRQDFGFSTVLSYGGKTILFDAGTDGGTFLSNLAALGVALEDVDIAVLSHGHSDHTGGLAALLQANPDAEVYLPNDFFSLGAPITFPFREATPGDARMLESRERYFGGKQVVEGMVTVPTGRFVGANVSYVTSPREILPGLTIVPTTAELMGTYIRYPPFDEHPQFIGMPELSLTLATPEGQVILAGCSHSTIEAIIRATLAVRPGRILMVAGGFHLIPYGREYIHGLATRMKETYGVRHVAPAHCTGHTGFAVFKEVFGEDYRFYGLGETLTL